MSCPRCGGSGYIREYDHIQGGRCFLCTDSIRYRRDSNYTKITKDTYSKNSESLTGVIIEESIKGIGKLTSKLFKVSCNITKSAIEKKKQFDKDTFISYIQDINKFTDLKEPIEVFKIYKKIFSPYMFEKLLKEKANNYGVSAKIVKNIYSSTIYNLLINNLRIEPDLEIKTEMNEKLIKLLDMIIYDLVEADEETLLKLIDVINHAIKEMISIDKL